MANYPKIISVTPSYLEHWNCENEVKTNIDGSVKLHSSRCMHDASFVALAPIVS